MKKFLLATAAIFVATAANAASGALDNPTLPSGNALIQNKANLDLKATLRFASEYNCTELNFGTITLNSNKDLKNVVVVLDPETPAPVTDTTVLEVKEPKVAVCGDPAATYGNDIFSFVTANGENNAGNNTITLTHGDGEGATTAKVTLKTNSGSYKVGGTLEFNIPDNSLATLQKWAGEYTGTATFTSIYN